MANIQVEDREFDIMVGQATNIVLNNNPEWAEALASDNKLIYGQEIMKAIENVVVRMIKMRMKIKYDADANWMDKYGINLLAAGRFKK